MNHEGKLALLAEGAFTRRNAKTAIGLLRYRRADCIAVVDSTNAGRDASECVGEGRGVPVVATVEEARRLGADTLAIGIATAGGEVPEAWYPLLESALRGGLHLANGLHTRLGDNPRLAAAARAGRARIWDVRRPPDELPIGGHRARRAGTTVVLTVGSDAAVGKMTVSLEIALELRRRGLRAEFVPTGQTGMMIAGWGIAVDAVVSDFVAGAAEEIVLDAAERAEWVIVEGQGALTHPGFSGVTLGLLHGCAPDRMVLVHDASRRVMKGYEAEGLRVCGLAECVRIHDEAARWSRPEGAPSARVVAVALNTYELDGGAARRAIDDASRETGLPATDAVRIGAGTLVDAILAPDTTVAGRARGEKKSRRRGSALPGGAAP